MKVVTRQVRSRAGYCTSIEEKIFDFFADTWSLKTIATIWADLNMRDLKDTTSLSHLTLDSICKVLVQLHLSLGLVLGGTCHLVVASSVLSNLIWSPLGWPSCGSQGPRQTICDDTWRDCCWSLWEILNSRWKEDYRYEMFGQIETRASKGGLCAP